MVSIPTAKATYIESDSLGFTLTAEGVFIITSGEVNLNWPEISFGAVSEEGRIADAVAKLKIAKANGVDTIVDRTLPGTGRNISLLKKVATESPVNILVCTGYYTWSDLPPFFSFSEKPDWNAHVKSPRPTFEDLFVKDVEVGISDTGVKAALIKFVTDRPGVTEGVRSLGVACARAHRRTGVPLTTHTGIDIGISIGLLQQDLFEREGVDLSRVQIGHVDFTPPDVPIDDFKRALDRGSYLSFDCLSHRSMFPAANAESRIDRIVELCESGYADQITLSGDSSAWNDVFPEGTILSELEHPAYTHVSLNLIPQLRVRGVSEAQVDAMTRHNPRRFIETRSRGAY
jgi:phosphotriesterase-related protein